MTLGELKAAAADPKLYGIGSVEMYDSRKVVVQVPDGEHPIFGPQFKYYWCRAAGVLFVDGNFVVAIAAGDKIGDKKGAPMEETKLWLSVWFQAVGLPVHRLEDATTPSTHLPKPAGTGVGTYDEALALGEAELLAGRWSSFSVEKFYKQGS